MAFFKNLFNKIRESKHFTTGVVVAGGTALTASIFAFCSFTKIPTGHIGYKSLYGKVYDEQYPPGFTFVNPMADMVTLDLRKKLIHSETFVTSSEGLEIKVDVDIVHHLDQKSAKDIYMNVGPSYKNVLLVLFIVYMCEYPEYGNSDPYSKLEILGNYNFLSNRTVGIIFIFTVTLFTAYMIMITTNEKT